ncbi:MAG: hypothetical protein RIR96_1648 [Bacteroidota bacterium]
MRTRGKLFSPVNPSQTTTVQANQFESIGNPYVSPIDFNLVGKTGVSVENAFWVWDPLLTGVEGLGGYQLLSAVNGDYLPTPGGTANYPTAQKCSTIQAGQAFFIHAPSAGPVNISFDENCKSENYSSAFRNSGNSGRYLRMQLNSVIQNQIATQDGAVIAWNSNYRKSVDAFDAVKLMNPGSSISLLHSSGQNLSIDARPLPRQIDTIPLTLNLTRSSAYQLHFEPDQLTGIPYSIALYDQMNYTVFNVDIERSSDVTINPILPLHLNKSRYFLIVKRQSSRSQLPISFVSEQNRLIRKNSENDTIQTVSTRIIVNNQPLSLIIKKNESISLIHVFDAQGKLILKKECDTKAITKVPVDMKLPEISTGVYFIRLMTNTGNTYVVQFFSR